MESVSTLLYFKSMTQSTSIQGLVASLLAACGVVDGKGQFLVNQRVTPKRASELERAGETQDP